MERIFSKILSKESVPQKIEFESVELPNMNGKHMESVRSYLVSIYGESALACIPKNLDELPEELKDGKEYVFFGSMKENINDGVSLPAVSYAGGWHKNTRNPRFENFEWNDSDRAVLNKKK